jgi:hypothetical protein
MTMAVCVSYHVKIQYLYSKAEVVLVVNALKFVIQKDGAVIHSGTAPCIERTTLELFGLVLIPLNIPQQGHSTCIPH